MKRFDFIRNLGFLPLVAVLPISDDSSRVNPTDFLLKEGWVLKESKIDYEKVEHCKFSHPKSKETIKVAYRTMKDTETWIFAGEDMRHFSSFKSKDGKVLFSYMKALYEVYKISLFENLSV